MTRHMTRRLVTELANFVFLHQAYNQYKVGSYTMQGEFLCLGNNAFHLNNNVLAPISYIS
jgi:hypothetical protein